MYNKLFTKILDSSIWLESTTTRLVWLTFIAVMDETGFCPFAAVGNVANRARVSLEEAQEAIACLENPDRESGNPDHEGRRIERVPGGWMVLNAKVHRDMVTRAVIQEKTRERVRRHREMKRTCNGPVTPSEAIARAVSETEKTLPNPPRTKRAEMVEPVGFAAFWQAYPRKVKRQDTLKAWSKINPPLTAVLQALSWQVDSDSWRKDGGQFIPYPTSYLNARRWEDKPMPKAGGRTVEDDSEQQAIFLRVAAKMADEMGIK